MHGYELRTQDDGSVALIEFTPTVIATFWDRSHAERYFGILCEFEVADASRPIFYPDHQTASAEHFERRVGIEKVVGQPFALNPSGQRPSSIPTFGGAGCSHSGIAGVWLRPDPAN